MAGDTVPSVTSWPLSHVSRPPKMRSMSARLTSSTMSQLPSAMALSTRPGRKRSSLPSIVWPPTRSVVDQFSSAADHSTPAGPTWKPNVFGSATMRSTTCRSSVVLPLPGGPTRITAGAERIANRTIRSMRGSISMGTVMTDGTWPPPWVLVTPEPGATPRAGWCSATSSGKIDCSRCDVPSAHRRSPAGPVSTRAGTAPPSATATGRACASRSGRARASRRRAR